MDPSSEKRADFDPRASWRTSTRLSIVGDDGSHDVSSSGTVVRPEPAQRPSLALALPPNHDPRHSALARGVHLTVPSALADDITPKERPRTAPGSPSSAPNLHLPLSDSRSLRHIDAHDSPTRTAPDGASNPSGEPGTPHGGPSRPYPIGSEVDTSMPARTAVPHIPGQSPPEHRGPTHPYALYPQSALASDAAEPESIPVGFPGIAHPHPYSGRIGQGTGVTGSFTGPIGHTEELPPYSRYPDEGYGEKTVGSSSATEAPATPMGQTIPTSPTSPTNNPIEASPPRTTPEAIAPIPGAGGIGLATRDPEFSSTSSNMGSPRLSARSFPSDASQHNINTATQSVTTEKGPAKSWQRRGSKKICGIVPYWAVLLLTVALILMGTILGAVIGTFLSRHRKPGPPDRPFRDFNMTDTVIPMKSVPEDLPALEIGEWGLPPWVTTQAPSTCVAIPTQAQAWSCNPALDMYYMEVGELESGSPTSAYHLKITTANNSTFNKYAWGTRSPVITDSEPLRLVNDTLEQGWGPAWWLRVPWNKIVVLPEDRFSVPSETNSRVRRDGPGGEGGTSLEGVGERDSKNSTEKPKNVAPFPMPMAKEGDKPWICMWPDTQLDIFIYAGQNNSFNTHGTAFTGFSDFPMPTGTGFPGYPLPTEPSTFITTSPSPGDPTSTAPVEVATAFPGSDSATDKEKERWTMPKFRPPYPKVIKISESRTPVSADSVAFCEQIEIIDGGKDHRPVLNESGKPIRVNIAEKAKDARRSPKDRRRSASTDVYRRDGPGSEFGECGCIWVFE